MGMILIQKLFRNNKKAEIQSSENYNFIKLLETHSKEVRESVELALKSDYFNFLISFLNLKIEDINIVFKEGDENCKIIKFSKDSKLTLIFDEVGSELKSICVDMIKDMKFREPYNLNEFLLMQDELIKLQSFDKNLEIANRDERLEAINICDIKENLSIDILKIGLNYLKNLLQSEITLVQKDEYAHFNTILDTNSVEYKIFRAIEIVEQDIIEELILLDEFYIEKHGKAFLNLKKDNNFYACIIVQDTKFFHLRFDMIKLLLKTISIALLNI